jgi:hypothetical protein
MKILALDLAKSRTGWAIWHRGWTAPRYGSVVLGSEYTTDGGVFARLHAEMAGLHQAIGFEVIYYEQAILPANLNGNTNLRALSLAAGLAAHVESFAEAMRCRAFAINVSAWRKDFVSADLVKDAQAAARAKRKVTGKGSARDKLKALTKDRCEQLGFSPRYYDEADAIGILDFSLDFHEHITPPWRADEVLRAPLGKASA